MLRLSNRGETLKIDLAPADETLMDQNNLPTQERRTRDWRVNAILDFEFPLRPMYEALVGLGQSRPDIVIPEQPVVRQIKERRRVLEGLPAEDLATIHARLTAQLAQKEEQQRFYNQRAAQADFKHWLSMDFWSLDDAVSLLLGKNPEVVNKTTVAQYLEKPKGFFAGAAKPPTKFTNTFQALQRLAERSNAMTASPRLLPLEVARWGATVLGGALPTPLADLLKREPGMIPALPSASITVSVSGRAFNTESVPVTEPKQIPAEADEAKLPNAEGEPLTLAREALIHKYLSVWPSIETNLKNAQRNGLAACAKSGIHGRWIEVRALEWAKKNGKLVDAPVVKANRANNPFNQ